jgi:hypothetical protein
MRPQAARTSASHLWVIPLLLGCDATPSFRDETCYVFGSYAVVLGPARVAHADYEGAIE